LLPPTARIVCAGARQGTEVEVLLDLGFKNAYGIDLNPGPNNHLVRVGDFMNMDNEDSLVDMIYTNCLDHAFNLDQLFTEHARVIRPDGYVLYDLSLDIRSGAGAFEAVAWASEEELFLSMLRYFKAIVRVESEPRWKWIILQGKREA
jgi:SAM-dependent methyltransferase